MERFDKWLASISARDSFQAPGGQAARDAVQSCRDAFTAFEAAALAADTEPDTSNSTATDDPQPRVVD